MTIANSFSKPNVFTYLSRTVSVDVYSPLQEGSSQLAGPRGAQAGALQIEILTSHFDVPSPLLWDTLVKEGYLLSFPAPLV